MRAELCPEASDVPLKASRKEWNMAQVNWIREESAKVQKAANRGNAEAAYELALRFFTGRKMDFDPAAGFYWAHYAARRGHMKARELCGYCLIRGVGTEADGTEAVHWLMAAARQGSLVAYYNLGCCYLVGIHFDRSEIAARVWFKAAAERGYERAEHALRGVDARRNARRAA